MKAFITSIGEPTTELCRWSLERQGFDVEMVKGDDSLASKLEYIYHEANDTFLRVDADVVVTRNVKNLKLDKDIWWVQPSCFSMYSQTVLFGGVQLIGAEALPILREHVERSMEIERPESFMFRLPEFHQPRRCISSALICGIHGFGQKDADRVRATKERRGQLKDYDFELAERLQDFYK